MVCPKCNNKYSNTILCPSCYKKYNVFYSFVIIIGIGVIILLIMNLINKNKTEENITYSDGSRSLVTYGLNKEFLSSIKDPTSDNYYDAHVKGIRVLNLSEVEALIKDNNLDYPLIDEYQYRGLVYEVSIYNLNDINYNPKLDVKYYYKNGNRYYDKYNDKEVSVISLGDNLISNNDTKQITVIYQTNNDNYALCIGNEKYKDGCINPSIK